MDGISFGKYIKQLRESKGMTLTKVSTIANISVAQLSRIENGVRNIPKADVLKGLAKAYEVPYEEVLEKAGYLTGVPEQHVDAVKDFFNKHHYYNMLYEDQIDKLLETKNKPTSTKRKLINDLFRKYSIIDSNDRIVLSKNKLLDIYKSEDLDLDSKKSLVDELVSLVSSIKLGIGNMEYIELERLEEYQVKYQDRYLNKYELETLKSVLVSVLSLGNRN